MQGVKRKRDENYELRLKAEIVDDLIAIQYLRKDTATPAEAKKYVLAMRHCAQLLRLAKFSPTDANNFLQPFKERYNPDMRPAGRKTRDRPPIHPNYYTA